MNRTLHPALLAGLAAAAPALAQPSCRFEFVPTPPSSGLLYSISGTGPSDVWAVGLRYGSPVRTLALHFDGTAWSDNATPDPSTSWNDLQGVLALGARDVYAVGSHNPPSGATQALALHFDGASWQRMDAPVVAGGSAFYDIAAIGPQREIWAVGARKNPSVFGPTSIPLAARWNGAFWDMFPVPYLGAGSVQNGFLGVSGTAPDNIWAIGHFNAGQGIYIGHFDGTGWTVMDPSPSFGFMNSLRDVVALAPDDVWAAGETQNSPDGLQPLIMHFDGSSWQRMQTPYMMNKRATLEAIAAVSPTEIYAAGTDATGTGIPCPLLMKYDGVNWTVIPAPSTGGSGEWFRGGAVLPAGSVWMVGQYFSGQTAPLTVRLDPCTPGCYANCDGSITPPVLNVNDFVCFLAGFAAGDPYADCDQSSTLNVNDFACFLNRYATGCP